MFARLTVPGFESFLSILLVCWAGGCGAILAVLAIICRVALPGRRTLRLGLGAGACAMIVLAFALWFWLGLDTPANPWVLVIALAALAVGAWAMYSGRPARGTLV